MKRNRFARIARCEYSKPGICSFGGDAPPQQSSTSTVQNYSPEEVARREKLMSTAEGIYNAQTGQWNSAVNPAARPVPASADTITGQNMVRSAALGPGQTVASNAGGALNFGLSGAALDPNSVPGFSGALDASLRRVDQAYTDPGGVLSQIRTGFTAGSSGGSGTREGIAGGIAGREYLNTVGDVSSKMALDQYGKGLDFMKSSMAFAPNMYNLMMQPGATVGAVGAQTEAYAQAEENANAGDRAWQLQAPWAGLQPWANVVQGMSNPSTTTTGTAPGARTNTGMGMLGGAMMGAQIGSMFGSPIIGAAGGALLSLLGG